MPVLFGAAMTVFLLEGFTNFSNVILALYALFLLAVTFLNGEWTRYRLIDGITSFFKMFLSLIIDPERLVISQVKRSKQKTEGEKKSSARKVTPFLRGILIALPLLLILGALLAQADLIFSDKNSNIIDWLKIEDFGSFVFRVFYISILAYALTGAFVYVFTQSVEKHPNNTNTALFKPFLGKVEALIVLISVNLLFAAFLIIQFRYFFGGNANINFEGFTYAEYARRGFFELIAVAIISLLIFFALSHITKRAKKSEKLTFSILGAILILQVGVMLLSAFYRLSLYEAAYGFTQERTVAHIFMIWLAVLLLGTLLLEVFNKLQRIALALFLVIFGFTITLNLVNVDRFIARQNIAHAVAGNELDGSYLTWTLSEDATPALFDLYSGTSLPASLHEELGGVLACRSAYAETRSENWPWVSYHYSRAQASSLYNENANLLEQYKLSDNRPEGLTVEFNGEVISCYYYIID
ncbi:MAG: DUF4173 domain-containing protein [Anaerolineaceae bacterium]|nr:DUF4173 domain-containing protein [Anaerolineaceae bacterium]